MFSEFSRVFQGSLGSGKGCLGFTDLSVSVIRGVFMGYLEISPLLCLFESHRPQYLNPQPKALTQLGRGLGLRV